MSSSEVAELQAAIQQGNIEQSQLIAWQLAEAKAKVIIRIDNGSNAVTPKITDAISVKLNLSSKYLNFYVELFNTILYQLLRCPDLC